MTTYPLKQGSTGDPFKFQLKDENGAIPILPDDTVTATMRKGRWGTIPSGLSLIPVEVIDGLTGDCQIDLVEQPAIVANPGVYAFEVQIESIDGVTRRIPVVGNDWVYVNPAVTPEAG